MKKTLLFIILALIGCSNKTKTSEYTMSLKSYNLKGKVEYFSDKKIPSNFIDKDWKTLIDSAQSSSFSIQNKYFDKSGFLKNMEYYDKDSILLLNIVFLYSKSGKYKGSKEFDKEGNQLKQTKIIESSQDLLKLETYDYDTGDLLSISETEYENGLQIYMSSEFVEQNQKIEYVFKRDTDGNEIEISSTVDFGEQKMENVSYIKYLDFDSIGNWTKRIDHNREKGKECMLTIRRIAYYE